MHIDPSWFRISNSWRIHIQLRTRYENSPSFILILIFLEIRRKNLNFAVLLGGNRTSFQSLILNKQAIFYKDFRLDKSKSPSSSLACSIKEIRRLYKHLRTHSYISKSSTSSFLIMKITILYLYNTHNRQNSRSPIF